MQYTRSVPPGPATSTATSTSSTTAVDLSAYEGGSVIIVATVATNIRFGTSAVGAAVATDTLLQAGLLYRFDIPHGGGRSYFRALAGSVSTITHAGASA